MDMTNIEYGEYVKKKAPDSTLWKDMLRAFISGGIICCIGQGFIHMYSALGADKTTASTLASVSLIFLGVLLTGLNKYDDLARVSGAGTLVPITGFANAVASPALEFKSEGYVVGMGAKMFVIAGPVIVFGLLASVIYGLFLVILG